MQILIKKDVRKEELKKYAGQWVDVDTEYLFEDQYNIKDFRAMDEDVAAVREDARKGMCRCLYCGRLLRAEDAEKHFVEEEKKAVCASCEYFRREQIDHVIEPEQTVQESPAYKEVIDIVHTVYGPAACRYNSDKDPGYAECEYKGHRRSGCELFTSGNTWFLKHPDGIYGYTIQDILGDGWWEYKAGIWRHQKNLGSFILELENVQVEGVPCFKGILYNTQREFSHIFLSRKDVLLQDALLPSGIRPKTWNKIEEEARNCLLAVWDSIQRYIDVRRDYKGLIEEDRNVNY